MSLIENIKDYFGQRKLNQLLNRESTRKRKFCNLNKAKSVGIIHLIKNESDLKRVQKFILYLKGELGIKKVTALGYIPEKETPEYIHAKLSFDFFTTDDLTWRKEPQKDNCRQFTENEFDVLIDLTKEFCLPLRFILVKSKAKFKVGRYSEDNKVYYDFMIEDHNGSLESFTQEIVRYLTVINA